MLIESFEHAEADFEARLLIEARNEAENVVQATEKSLRRSDFAQLAGREVSASEMASIEAAMAALKMAVAATDREVIHKKTHALNDATRHLAEVMMNNSVREALAGKSVEDV
jgi:molecular chaperone DnaK/molecular chaperone HscA